MRPGVGREAILVAVRTVLRDAGMSGDELKCLATVDRRAGEPGLVAAAAELGVPVLVFSAGELDQVAVSDPSARVSAALGTASIAEAAARRAGGKLVVPKRVVDGVVVAVAELPSGDDDLG